MIILSIILFLMGAAFCLFALMMGHQAAWPAAALCFFASTCASIKVKNNKQV